MALLILFVVGAVLGWVASIIRRIEDGRGILTVALVGALGAIVAGALAGRGLLLGALSATALLWAVVGAAVLVSIFVIARARTA